MVELDDPSRSIEADEAEDPGLTAEARPGGPAIPHHPGGERGDILRARPVPREASSQRGQWASGHNPGTRKDRKVRSHRKAT